MKLGDNPHTYPSSRIGSGKTRPPSGVLRGRTGHPGLITKLKDAMSVEGRRTRSPHYRPKRCPWLARPYPHEGSEALPVVSTGEPGRPRPERGSRPGHVAVGTEV